MSQYYSEVRDGMCIEWDVPIEMDDEVVLRADVYRPPEEGKYPVILSYGPYGKWLHFEDGYVHQWEQMTEEYPDVVAGSTNKYQNWETVDPEKWVPDEYAVVRVDSRGSGRSPGYLNVWSDRETRDLEQCIKWAGDQNWSNNKVGLNGISYYAMNQWQVAQRRPEYLAAICAWEGAADWYRDAAYHGGIYSGLFPKSWYDRQVKTVQNGVGENGYRSSLTGGWVSGPETLSEEQLGANRVDLDNHWASNNLATDDYWAPRIPDLSRIEVPLLSAGNWGGHGLHLRGNVEGFTQATSTEKYLEIHGGAHWTGFYTDYGVELQKRFFDYYLKDKDNGWEEQPPVQLQIRYPGEKFEQRTEDAWPIPRTEWTRYYLDASEGLSLGAEEPTVKGSITYDALGDGVTFLTDPFEEETELTGPMSAKLFVESDTEDADLFLVLRVFKPDLEEVVFRGAIDPHKPVANGWLRASHRKVDEQKSEPWRPYHTHDEIQPLEPGEIYELDIEIWPSCIVVPERYRVGLSVRGTDYEYPGDVDTDSGLPGYEFTGSGPFVHIDPRDRPVETYGGDVTIHTGPDHQASLLLPVVPKKE
ncbi:CocE/NonD family hydrolase [Halobellus rufus]|uniref:CocE/NonD family hydrolase n=1 Tax=Halobellus rufus TaxID=1448860 RepID=UPI000ADAE249|nr:CocE/NonD family hydrolase [Halobellus rufus]